VSGDIVKSLGSWIEENHDEPFLEVLTAPADVQAFLSKMGQEVMMSAVEGLTEELQRCYGTELHELTRRGADASETFRVTAANSEPPWSLSLSTKDKAVIRSIKQPLPSFGIQPRGVARRLARSNREREIVSLLVEDLYDGLMSRLFSSLDMFTFYFPAARSGILHSHKILASFLVRQSPFVGVQRIDIPPLSGVITDFIGELITLQTRQKTKLFGLAEFIENRVIGGEVSIEAGKLEYPEIYYQREPNRYPLHRTSSMVSELAPIILFLKHIIEPGDFVIIEEPESHLHPGSQRNLAWGIARLVREGVKILITTHSDYFLNQLNNFIRLSQPEVRERKEEYHNAYVEPEEVGAYLFEDDEQHQGSIIRQLPVTADEGIPEDEFAKVASALYQETTELQS
jgi:hypothetical protein